CSRQRPSSSPAMETDTTLFVKSGRSVLFCRGVLIDNTRAHSRRANFARYVNKAGARRRVQSVWLEMDGIGASRLVEETLSSISVHAPHKHRIEPRRCVSLARPLHVSYGRADALR